MDKLSVEILSTIFTYLHYEQKKQCMLVCHSWAQVIQSGGLKLETILSPYWMKLYIDWHTRESVQRTPETAGCHRMGLLQYHNKATLAKLFPNLRFLLFYPGQEVCAMPSLTVHFSGVVPEEYIGEEIEHLKHWHDRLETLIDYDFTNELFVFLNSGVFHRLTTLILNPDYNFPRIREIADTFFECLKNTPNLKLIDFKISQFSIAHLEKLHSYVPHLETLRFNYYPSMNYPDPESLNIHSKATSLKTLEVGMNRHYSRFRTALAQYILSKYPNLQEFVFYCDPHSNNELSIFLPQLLCATETTLTKLEIYAPKMTSSTITSLQVNPSLSLTTLELMLCDFPPDPTTRIFYRGGQRFARPGPVSPDENSEEKQKDIFDLVQWVESSNLTSLSLINIPNVNISVFSTLIKLKELKLKFLSSLRVEAELNWVITELPQSLESLSLSSIDLHLKEDGKKDWHSISDIKRLELVDCRIQSDFSDYLSNQLPLLKTFIHRADQFVFDLRLTHSHLSLVEISFCFRDPVTIDEVLAPNKFTPRNPIKVTVGNKTRIYTYGRALGFHKNTQYHGLTNYFNVHDHSMHDVITPARGSVRENDCSFHFQCESVQTLLYGENLILL